MIMEAIRVALEEAVNNTFPMRTLNKGLFGVAGNFYVDGNKYAFFGTFNEECVTCRCMEKDNYANHWFKMDRDWVDGKPVITVGDCL
jgi:hypothetical protein